MKYTPIGTPATGRRRGIVYSINNPNPGAFPPVFPALPRARATAIPIQPGLNPQVTQQQALAVAAAFWAALTPTEQAVWNNYPGPGSLGYNNSVAFNTLLGQWGLDLFDAPPGFNLNTGAAFVSPYAEPDGIHTTLATIAYGTPTPGFPLYIHVYVSWTAPTFVPGYSLATLTSPTIFLGSFGPISNDRVYLFDMTDAQTAAIGQWVPNGCVDTGSDTTCGGAGFAATWYETDQFGRPSSAYLPELIGPYQSGPGPGPIEPGICPLPTSPPYPWPTSSEYYA